MRSAVDGTNQFTKVNDRPVTPENVGGSLKVTGFNVLNYFKTIDLSGVSTAIGQDPRGADTTAEFDRQTDKLVTALLAIDADVLGLAELENDFLPAPVAMLLKTWLMSLMRWPAQELTIGSIPVLSFLAPMRSPLV